MLVLANVSKTYPQRRPRPARNLAADRPRPVRFAWPERRRQVHADAHDRHVAGARWRNDHVRWRANLRRPHCASRPAGLPAAGLRRVSGHLGARSARPPRAAQGTHGPHDTPCAGRGATSANNAHWPAGHGCVADVIQATPRSISGKCCRTPNPAIHYESTTSPAGRSSSRRRFGCERRSLNGFRLESREARTHHRPTSSGLRTPGPLRFSRCVYQQCRRHIFVSWQPLHAANVVFGLQQGASPRCAEGCDTPPAARFRHATAHGIQQHRRQHGESHSRSRALSCGAGCAPGRNPAP